jgi:NADH-quinone oxidoreductase E subunit
MQFSPETEAKFQSIVVRYPVRRAALLPTLWLAQEQFGHLSLEVMEYVAERLELHPAFVGSVASFYTMFYKRPMGRHHVQVCTNLSCALVGSDRIVDCLRRRLGIDVGQTTGDGQFSLSEVECLASCGTAPMMQINDDYWENLTPERTIEIIDRLAGA